MFVWLLQGIEPKTFAKYGTGVDQHKHTEFIVKERNVKIKTSPAAHCTVVASNSLNGKEAKCEM
jgi:hypothetical protein